MDKDEAGSKLRADDPGARRDAARVLGMARTERKSESSRENGRKGGAYVMSDETRERMRQAQQARRERERQVQESAGSAPAVRAVNPNRRAAQLRRMERERGKEG
jgi:hypothetical protein